MQRYVTSTLIFLILLCFFFAQPSMALSPAEPLEGKDHLWWAEKLVSGIDQGSTSYVHQRRAGGVGWGDKGSGAYSHTDCSGFTNALFEHTYGFDHDYMGKWLDMDPKKTGPTASKYYASIVAQRGFRHIKKLTDVLPGDILAIYYAYDKSNTGHVMVIAGLPRKIGSGQPLVDGTEQWQVLIIDSSRSPHWKGDTRWKGEKPEYDGLGKGMLRLYSGSNGEIAGYTWSLSPKSKFHSIKERPLAAGRFDREYHIRGTIIKN
jgi:hypothetical protein